MVDVEKVTLSDGITYVIVDEIIENNINYVYLVNEKDEKDFCIRKSVIEEGEEFFIGLNSDVEFEKALLYFTKKNSL